MAKVNSRSANQSIELVSYDTRDECVLLRVAREWVEHRPDKLTAEQMEILTDSTNVDQLRTMIMDAQTYKVERIRRELIDKLNELNTELGRATRHVGFCDREDNIKYAFGPLNIGSSTPYVRQTKIIFNWREIRRPLKELPKLEGEERLEMIRKIFRLL
jgi:hypothetical protein